MNLLKRLGIVLLCLCFGQLQAQNQIKGFIQDSKTENGIKLVQLRIIELNKQTETNEEGSFLFENIPSGNYSIVIQKEGFSTQLINYDTKEPKLIRANLNITEYAMKEVLISGAKACLPERTTQFVDQINLNSINTNGDLTIGDALARVPGVSIITTGPGIARPVIRGLSCNRIATIANQVKLENQQWDLEHALGINQFGASKIEIIKGPASFLYGNDAMGGLIHLIDESPASIHTTAADISSSFNSNTFGTSSEIGVKQTNQKVFWGIRTGLNNHSDYYDANDKRIANSRFRELNTKLFLGINRKKSLTYFSYQMNIGYYGIVEPFENDSNSKEKEDHPMEFEKPYHTLQHHSLLAKNTLFLGNTQLTSSIAYQYDGRNEFEPSDNENNPFLGFNLHTLNTNIQLKHTFNAVHTITTGIQGTGFINTNDGYSKLIPNYQQLDFGVYLLSQNALLKKKLLVDFGLRYDIRTMHSEQNGLKDSNNFMASIQKSFDNFSSSIGLNFEANEHLHFVFNSGLGFRVPNMAELTSNGYRLETQRYEIGNVQFKNEINKMQELGIILSRKDWSLSGSLFANAIQNFIYTYNTADSLSINLNGSNQKAIVYRFAQANALFWGYEGKFNWHPSQINWFNFSSSYSNTNASFENGLNLPLIPPYKLNNQLVIKHHLIKQLSESNIRIEYSYIWNQAKVFTNELQTPGYHLVNLSLTGKLSILKHQFLISTGVNNLLSTSYLAHLSRLRQYQIHGMGMNFFINIKLPLQYH